MGQSNDSERLQALAFGDGPRRVRRPSKGLVSQPSSGRAHVLGVCGVFRGEIGVQ